MGGSAAGSDLVQRGYRIGGVRVFAEPEASPDGGRPGRPQLGLDGFPVRRREPLWSLDDDVEDNRPCSEPQLGLLAVQIEHRLLDRSNRAGARPGPPVEDPVDGRLR